MRVLGGGMILALGWIDKDDLPVWLLMLLISLIALGLVMFEFFASQLKLGPNCTTGLGECEPDKKVTQRPEPRAPRSVKHSVASTNDVRPHSSPLPRSNITIDVEDTESQPKSRTPSNMEIEIS